MRYESSAAFWSRSFRRLCEQTGLEYTSLDEQVTSGNLFAGNGNDLEDSPMTTFDLHAAVLNEYRDLVRSFILVADPRIRDFVDRVLDEEAHL